MVIIIAQVVVAYVNRYTIPFLLNMDLAEFVIYGGRVLLTASLSRLVLALSKAARLRWLRRNP
jgi:hypothetical protein